jgi:hypothetical protein
MKIIILITVVETLMLMLWLAYSSHRRRQSDLRIATTRHPDGSSSLPAAAHWSAINRSQVQGQADDRRPLNGAVTTSKGMDGSVHRAFARKSRQLMYKKWSKDRHED